MYTGLQPYLLRCLIQPVKVSSVKFVSLVYFTVQQNVTLCEVELKTTIMKNKDCRIIQVAARDLV